MILCIAFPVSGLGDGLPDEFKPATQACLQEFPVDENVSFPAFAERLIAQGGLEWHSQDQSFAQSILQTVVARLVIEPLTAFGVLVCEYITEKTAEREFKKLTYIRLTAVGKGMLDLLM